MDWYPWFPVHYRRDTLHLTFAEDGAYRRLIDEYMVMGGPLPDDDAVLARLLGVGIDAWMKVAPAVRGFFKPKNGRLAHARCDRELVVQLRRKERFSKRGQKAAHAKWSKMNGLNARRMLVHATVHNKDTPIHSSECVAVPQEASEVARTETDNPAPTKLAASPELVAVLMRSVGVRG